MARFAAWRAELHDLAAPLRVRHEHATIGPKGQAIVGDRRPQEIPTQPFELAPILRTDGCVGVKIEAAEAGVSATLGRIGPDRGRVSEAKDGCSGASSHGDPLAYGTTDVSIGPRSSP